MTMAPIPASALKPFTAATSSVRTWEFSALSAFGLFSVISPTLPRVSVMIVS